MKKKKPDSLPNALAIAGRTVALDNIKIVPTTDFVPIRKSIRTIKIGDWNERLLNKSVSFLTNDINKSLKENKDSVFYPYIMAQVKEKLLFVTLEMSYEIK